MPTPEASASSSVALRNANITELAIEEADSFKANESIMTQDQCLDNGHQANSNNIRSSSDKVSDDLNNSKNSVVSNGVNISVQEFNVDVNREYSTDLVMVQNRTVDADSPPTGEVLSPTSKQLTQTPSDLVDSKNILDNSKNNIDANKSECANNIVADMTVITHQNSSENIRDIIANSEKANKNSNDSNHHHRQQLDRVVEKNSRSDINLGNSRSANRSAGTRRSRKLVRSANVNECEDVEIEDPIERLNKLRASISSALSEVKGVLKQYSTEQSCDDQNESAPSKQPLDDGPVRFRFVRKIRRRSVFSEDDTTEIPKTSTDATASPITENKAIEEVPKEFQDNQKTLSNENKDLTDQIKDEAIVPSSSGEIEKPINKDKDEADTKLIQTAETESSADIEVPQDKSDNNSITTVSEVQQKTSTEDSSIIAEVEVPSSTSGTTKVKNGKTKKILKKDRRASIAAVEINQISNDQLPIPEDLKTQRRPSDSGTLVKQTTRIKAKTSEKPKLVSSRKAKTGSSSSKTESSITKLSQTSKAVEKTQTALSPTDEKTPSLLVESTKTSDIKTSVTTVSVSEATKPTVPVTSISVISPQSTQETTSPAILESKPLEKTAISTKADLSKANASAGDSIAELNTPEVTPVPTASSIVNADVPKPAPKLIEVNTPSASKLNKPEVIPAPAVASPVNTAVPKPSPNVTEVNKLNTPQVKTAPAVSLQVSTAVPQISSKKTEVKLSTPKAVTSSAVSTKVKDDLSEIVAEMSVTCVKPYTADVPIPSQQSLKASPEAAITKVGTSNQQITKSQVPKTGTPNNKSITPVSPPKTPEASPSAATVKVESSKSINSSSEVLETKTVTPVSTQANKKPKMITEAERIEASKAASEKALKALQPAEKIVENKKSNESVDSKPSVVPKQSTTGTSKIAAEASNKIDQKTSGTPETLVYEASGVEVDEPKPSNVPKDAVAVKFNLPGQESVEELQRLEEQQVKEISPPQTPEIPVTPETPELAAAVAAPPKKKRKAKRKVVIRRIKRKLSKDDTFIHQQEAAAELEICEKEIEEKDLDEQPEEEISESPKQPKSCLKNRAFEIGDVVMYAEHYKKTQVRWKKAVVTERITSISYKLNIEGGDERPAHISYIKKFTNRKVNFGGKEYLEIDYAQIEDDEEKERNYSIWNLV